MYVCIYKQYERVKLSQKAFCFIPYFTLYFKLYYSNKIIYNKKVFYMVYWRRWRRRSVGPAPWLLTRVSIGGPGSLFFFSTGRQPSSQVTGTGQRCLPPHDQRLLPASMRVSAFIWRGEFSFFHATASDVRGIRLNGARWGPGVTIAGGVRQSVWVLVREDSVGSPSARRAPYKYNLPYSYLAVVKYLCEKEKKILSPGYPSTCSCTRTGKNVITLKPDCSDIC